MPLLVPAAAGRLDGVLVRGHPFTLHHARAEMKLDTRQTHGEDGDTRRYRPSLPRSVDGHDQYPAIPARPGPPPVHPDAEHHPGMGAWRNGCSSGSGRSSSWRAAGRQRPQAGDGRLRPAGAGPHDRDVPQRPRLLLEVYRKYGPVHYAKTPALAAVAALGPDATQAVFSNKNKDFSQKGWHPVIGPFFNRGPDAAGLRRAHVPPPDHAGGLHPDPAVRLRRAHRPGRLAGRRQRLGRPTMPGSCSTRR